MSTGSVAVAVVSDMPLYELAIACEVFGVDRSELAEPWYDLRLFASSPSDRVEFGFAPPARQGLEGLADADTVIIPSVPYACVEADRSIAPELVEAIRHAYAAGARMVSLCSGAFALAAAGILDGRRAATHWMHAATLADRYPKVRVDASVLYVDDGDILTSAGRSAGLDLCLHLVRRDLGAEIANQLARRMVVPAHRSGGQAQYVDRPVPRADGDDLASLLQWAIANLDQPLTVARLARRANLSSRTLLRRFQASTGTTPLRWLLEQRVLRARSYSNRRT